MKSRVTICSCVLAFIFATSLAASAGGRASCEKPFVFERSAVNTVVLPFRYVGSRQELNNVGSWLAQLIQSDTLIRTIPYGSIAAVLLEEEHRNSPECEPDIVLAKLLGERGNMFPPIRPGNGLVLVWGIVYEQGDDIFLKSFATVIRRGARIATTVKIGDSSFVAEPSARVVSFSPRKISRQTLVSIEQAYNRANRVYERPEAHAPSNAVPSIHCQGCSGDGRVQAYYIDRRQQDWIHVTWSQGMGDERSAGWMRTGGNIEARSLDSVLPELHFIRASVGYLSSLIAGSAPERERTRKLALNDFSKFNQTPGETPISSAVALQLSGMMRLSGGTKAETWNLANAEFNKAYELAPYSPEAKSLVAIGHIYQDTSMGLALERSKERARELAEVQLLKPQDAGPTENLINYYSMLLPQAKSKLEVIRGLSADELQGRIVALQDQRARRIQGHL